MDLSKLSDADLMALQSGDLSKVSDAGLKALQGTPQPSLADREKYAPTVGMSGVDRFLAGTGKAFADIGRGVGQMTGLVSRDDVEEARKLDKPLMATGAGTAGNIAGNVAAAVPTAFIPGANTIAGSAAIGAGMGLLQPSTSTSETLNNVALGGVGGAAIPALFTAGRVGKSFVEPFYEGGRNQILARALRDASGGQADEAIRQLRAAAPLVPGSLPTVGEATNIPSLAATQRAAMATSPQATNQLAGRQAAQNEARIAALQNVTPDVNAARATRESVSGALYDRARGAGMGAPSPEIEALMQRVPEDLVNQARQLARISGQQIDDAGSVQGAHWLKKAIDSRIGQAVRSGDNETARAYRGLQDEFLNVLESQNPAYGAARRSYAELSRPINQGEILGDITQRAQNFRGDITPARFSQVATDRAATGATGMPNATLENTLAPNQMQTIRDITADLLRSDFANNAGRGVGSDTVQKLAYSNMLNQAGVPSAVRNFGPAGIVGNVAQRFGQVAYKDANDRIAAELAELMMNPQVAAQVMESGAANPRLMALVNGLRRSGTAIGATTPGLVQANQQ